MNIVTLSEAQKFLNLNEADSTLLNMYVDSAEEAVRGYLNYDPIEDEYTKTFSQKIDMNFIRVGVKPISSLHSIRINDVTQSLTLFSFENDFIDVVNGEKLFTAGYNNIEIVFTAGYGLTTSGDSLMPVAIKETVLQIAAVKKGEKMSQGQSTISTPDRGTRTFRAKSYGYEDILQNIARYGIVTL